MATLVVIDIIIMTAYSPNGALVKIVAARAKENTLVK